ncbi:MAG: diacylglycerol/lipid kinase family protein [Chloroflexota bacterium]
MVIAAIVNPAAGNGRSEARWARVERLLDRSGVTVRAVRSEGPGHAEQLVGELLKRRPAAIIAAGGDGTFHEVVNGLYAAGNGDATVPLGLVYAGTGMDLSRNLRMSRATESTAQRILSGRSARVDLGACETTTRRRVFVNFGETGIGAAVVAREASMHSHLPGRLSFLFAALHACAASQPVDGRVLVDGACLYAGRLLSVVAANGRFFGGGMKIAPVANMADGLLDVVVLGDFSRPELFTQIWKIYPGLHVEHPQVFTARGSTVSIQLSRPTQLDLDGELYEDRFHSFQILPGALRVLV